jgi:hypothetical protein
MHSRHGWIRSFVSVLALAALCLVAPSRATAQSSPTLKVEGDHFTVNGTPKFLVLVSYFDAMKGDMGRIQADFNYFSQNGIDGVRIFANWQSFNGVQQCSGGYSPYAAGTTLFNANGTLNATQLAKLIAVLNTARSYNLVVDLTMDRVPGSCTIWDQSLMTNVSIMCMPEYRTAIGAVTDELRNAGMGHVMFDLGNERDMYNRAVYISDADIDGIQDYVYLKDPNRILMASNTEYTGTSATAVFAQNIPLSVIAFHEDRNGSWWTNSEWKAAALRSASSGSRPVYLQEPERWCPGSGLTAAHFRAAAEGAKRGGAAAWMFHSESGFNLRTQSFLDWAPPLPEEDFITSFRTPLNGIAWNVCHQTISPTGTSAPAGGGSGTVTMTNGAGCNWAVSNPNGWISVSGSGSGNGSVSYSVSSNPSASPRSGSFSVGSRLFTVTQAGTPPPTLSARGYGELMDMSGDFKADVADFHKASAQYWFRRNNGNGTFEVPGVIWRNGVMGSSSTDWELLVADFTGDGVGDYADRHIPSGQIWVHANYGNGTFDTVNTWATANSTTSANWEVLAGDVTGDARADIIEHDRSTGQLRVRANSGPGVAFSGPVTLAFTTQVGPDWRLIVANFSGGHRADVADFHIPSGQFWVHRNTGAWDFYSWHSDFGTGYAHPVFTTIFGDFDGDGWADYVDVQRQTGDFWVHLNNRNGTFAPVNMHWGSGLFTSSPGFSILGMPITMPPQ